MKRLTKYGLALVGAGVLAVVVVWVSVAHFASPDMCGNDQLAQYLSPDGSKQLVVFQRDCGATTGFSTQASILEARAVLPNESGNVFVADCDHGIAPSGPGGGPELHARWESAQRLRLAHHPQARVFKAEQRVSDVEIRYEHFK